MKKYQDAATLLLRMALAADFFSAVASRFGLWGKHSSSWTNFVAYTGQVNSFAPAGLIPTLAIASTLLELVFAILLLTGWKTRWAAGGTAILTFLFAAAMAFSFGPKEPLDYSVFADCTGALLLATLPGYRWSIDGFIAKNKKPYMKSANLNQLVRSNKTEWKPLAEPAVKTDGIYAKVLRFDEAAKRPPTFLLKFDAGASYPNHNHPAGEEIFVLEGEVRFGAEQLFAGDYLYTAPGETHSAYSETGCTMLFVVPEEVVIL